MHTGIQLEGGGADAEAEASTAAAVDAASSTDTDHCCRERPPDDGSVTTANSADLNTTRPEVCGGTTPTRTALDAFFSDCALGAAPLSAGSVAGLGPATMMNRLPADVQARRRMVPVWAARATSGASGAGHVTPASSQTDNFFHAEGDAGDVPAT